MNFGKTFKVACSNNKEKNMQNMSLALIHRHGLKFLLNSPVLIEKKIWITYYFLPNLVIHLFCHLCKYANE